MTTPPATAVAGSDLTTLPAVRVTDANGRPVAGITVTFAVTAGNGTISGAVQMTSPTGVASLGGWKLGTAAGANSVTATVGDLSPVTFSVTGIAGSVAALVLVQGNAQTDTTHATLAPIVVRAVDANTNPVAGVAITFTAPVPGGQFAPGTVTTDSLGLARTLLTLGDSAGAITAQAAAGAVTVAITETASWPPPRAVAIAVGASHACAIGVDQRLYCWGGNDVGQIGDGSLTNRLVPVVVADAGRFAQIAAGGNETCALTSSGAAYCWGQNDGSELGDGTTTNRSQPTAVQGGLSFASIAIGGSHTCAITAAGDAYCWGIGSGDIGDGSANLFRPTPTRVSGAIHYVAITAGVTHSCGLDSGGAAYCWGLNDSGQLGDGTTTDRTTPVAVAGGLQFTQLSSGYNYNCGLVVGGAAYCWGANAEGMLGTGNTTSQPVPTAVQGGYTFTQIATGTQSTCAINSTSHLLCWGKDVAMAGPDPGYQPVVGPRPASLPNGVVLTKVAKNSAEGCGIATDAVVYCWGLNQQGAGGDGTTTYRPNPTPVRAH